MKFWFLIFLFPLLTAAQSGEVLPFAEFLGYVKQFHPMVKAAGLSVSEAEANLMAARGAFDPKLSVDYDRKRFDGSEYYTLLNQTFKIPTWFGVELKAERAVNTGYLLNPQNTVPPEGLNAVGISIPLGQGFLINERMADLKKAKIMISLSEMERRVAASEIVYRAALAYFEWQRCQAEMKLYEDYLQNARLRLSGMESLIENGDRPAIDSVDTSVSVNVRLLGLEEARLKLRKAKLELSKYLWLDNSIPVELTDSVIPEAEIADLPTVFGISASDTGLAQNPKIIALTKKIEMLDINRRLKSNALLPKVDFAYNWLSDDYQPYLENNYKIGLNVSFPIFLRKERGQLKMAKFKLQAARLELEAERLDLDRKVKALRAEVASLDGQQKIASRLIAQQERLLAAEEVLFYSGESSIFLINNRENNLVGAKLTALQLIKRYNDSLAALYLAMVLYR